MGYWISLLFLHCIYSSISLPTERERTLDDVAGSRLRGSATDETVVGVVAHKIATRAQDPTENLVCRLVRMKAPHPQNVIVVPAAPDLSLGSKYWVTPASVTLRDSLYSPAMYAALCVSPEKPKPFPLFFAPPAPLASPSAAPASVTPPNSKNPSTGSRPSSALNAPPPAISLVISGSVGSIGLGSISSPAVNIGTQTITDLAEKPTWLIKRIILPFR